MSQIKNRITFNLILIFSVFALGVAYFVQYILGHKPCNLCLIERIPYIFTIIIISLGLILCKNGKYQTIGNNTGGPTERRRAVTLSYGECLVWFGF